MQCLLHTLPLLLLLAAPVAAEPAFSAASVDPPALRLSGPAGSHSLLINGQSADGLILDLTHDARYHTANPKVATVSPSGVVEAIADGTTTIGVTVAGKSL